MAHERGHVGYRARQSRHVGGADVADTYRSGQGKATVREVVAAADARPTMDSMPVLLLQQHCPLLPLRRPRCSLNSYIAPFAHCRSSYSKLGVSLLDVHRGAGGVYTSGNRVGISSTFSSSRLGISGRFSALGCAGDVGASSEGSSGLERSVGFGFGRARREGSMSGSGASGTTVSQATASSFGGNPQHVIVVGGGVIGCCTAYFLGKLGAKVTVVEKTEIACAASGKAGGFLALDWCDGSAVQDLARASFALHEQLANELDGESYGYRRVGALSVSVEEPRNPKQVSEPARKPGTPGWIDGSIKGSPSTIGTTSTNAQVHPQLFTRAVFSEAQEKYGASLLIGGVQEVKVEGKRVTGVVVDGKLVTGDAVVLAMGPWSSRNPLISSLTTVSGLKAHSIVLLPKDPNAISPHTLFLKYKTREGKSIDPEIYPRGTGEVYVCGMSEEVEVPEDAREILPRTESTAMLRRVAATVSSHLVDAELSVAQACFLPCSEDNVPVIGKLPSLENAYVATGHSCWGILNAPATGAALAELIVDGVPKTCSLKAFDPSRFSRLRSRR